MLAKAVCQATSILTVLAPSRASPLPHGLRVTDLYYPGLASLQPGDFNVQLVQRVAQRTAVGQLLFTLADHGLQLRQVTAGLRLLDRDGVEWHRMVRMLRAHNNGSLADRRVFHVMPVTLFLIFVVDITTRPIAA